MRINSLFYTDGYKIGHKEMLAERTTRLYGTWIPRSVKHAPNGVNKIVSFGQQLVVKWLHHEFQENFFNAIEYEYETAYFEEDGRPYQKPTGKVLSRGKETAIKFTKDMCLYLGLEFNGKHFEDLWDLGYLPIEIQSLPEGIETNPNIPHMTFINTVDGFGWLTLYLETIISSLAWKPATSATIALYYRRQCTEWVMKTDPDNAWLIPYLCHDFSARGLNPHDMIASGLGHATSFRGSDTLSVIPAARYYYNEPEDEVCINSVNASEHSVSTTKIFTVGERQMIIDWLKKLPNGVFSMVCDTFSTWEFIEFLRDPEIRELIINRNGKLVVRPDSGDPVDIICGSTKPVTLLNDTAHDVWYQGKYYEDRGGRREFAHVEKKIETIKPSEKGVIELLWDIFGGTINAQGYKVLDPRIGAIYGDSINTERQYQIYKRLEAKGFAVTNVVLGVGSFTYQFNTRDTFGFAAKGAWFEVEEDSVKKGYSIYKDPVTDDGTKKSLKGFQYVEYNTDGEYEVISEVSEEKAYSESNILRTIYKNGEFFNQTTLSEVREKLEK